MARAQADPTLRRDGGWHEELHEAAAGGRRPAGSARNRHGRAAHLPDHVQDDLRVHGRQHEIPGRGVRGQATASEAGVVEIYSTPGGAHGALLEVRAGPKEKPSKGDVIFQRYGDTYVLKTLWVAGSGVTLVETYAEKATKAKGGTPTEHPVTATPKGKN